MGEEISSTQFTAENYKTFRDHLSKETEIVQSWFNEKAFVNDERVCGIELEAWLVDKDFKPAPSSESYLKELNNSKIVPELSKYNFEMNTTPEVIQEDCLSKLHKQVSLLWRECRASAAKLNLQALGIGVLPTITPEMMTTDNLYPYKRYIAFNNELEKYRKGEPINVHIEGRDKLEFQHDNVLIETAATSLQAHVQMKADEAIRYYNAAHIISAALIATSSNSPFFMNKDLWDETRIPIFEQAAAIPYDENGNKTKYARVTFGNGFMQESYIEPFLENLNDYLILLPVDCDAPAEKLKHFHLHNGTIWRWNRPIIGHCSNGQPHLRLEHRVNAAGPSIPDIIANLAFFLGLVHYYAHIDIPLEKQISFADAKANFYQAARNGLQAEIKWVDATFVSLHQLIQEHFITNAREGLVNLNICQRDIDYYLNIITQRLESRQNGAAWQRKFVASHGNDMQEMLFNYLENQKREIPVHEWSV